MDWQTFIDAIGGRTSLVSAVGFLFVLIFQYRYGRNLARVTHELGIVSKRQEIIFSSLHQRRAEIIAKLYEKLVLLNNTLLRLSIYKDDRAEQEPGERILAVVAKELKESSQDKLVDLAFYIDTNKIYFPLQVFESLGGLYKFFTERFEFLTREHNKSTDQEVDATLEQLRKESDKAIFVIERHFRELLEAK